MARLVLSFVFAFLFSSCSTPGAVYLNDLSLSLVDLQKVAIEASPIRVRKQSRNGREYYSEYFTTKGGEYVEAGSESVRKFSVISILGDRRPYKIEVRVLVESRGNNANYSIVKDDQGMARVISRRIQKALHLRREDRNIIDDFRVF